MTPEEREAFEKQQERERKKREAEEKKKSQEEKKVRRRVPFSPLRFLFDVDILSSPFPFESLSEL